MVVSPVNRSGCLCRIQVYEAECMQVFWGVPKISFRGVIVRLNEYWGLPGFLSASPCFDACPGVAIHIRLLELSFFRLACRWQISKFAGPSRVRIRRHPGVWSCIKEVIMFGPVFSFPPVRSLSMFVVSRY